MKIKYEDIKYSYDAEDFINIDELKFKSDRITNIIGKNAAGKSTLSKILSGLIEAEDMKVFINDEQVEVNKVKVGVVFQNPDFQFIATIVRDDIAFGLENMQVDREQMITKINQYAKLFKIEELLDSEIRKLSGGQKQKVAMVSNLILNPKVLILDEVFEMLDSKAKIEIIEILKEYVKQNEVCIINISHDENIIDEFDDVMVLDRGRVIANMDTNSFFKNQKLLKELRITRPFKYDIMEVLEIDEVEYEEKFWK